MRRVTIISITVLALAMALPVCPEEADNSEGIIGSQLSLFNAVRITLGQDPNIQTQEYTVDSYEGALQSAHGTFDPAVTLSVTGSNTYTPYTTGTYLSSGTRESVSTSRSASASVSQTLRTGMVLEPSASLTRTDTLRDQNRPVYTSSVDFSITQPLLQGAGLEVNTASEKQAACNLRASQYTLVYTVSGRIKTVTDYYWSCLDSYLRLQTLRESEGRMRDQVDVTRRLIDADQRPAADLEQLQGALTGKISTRLSAEQSLFSARQSLGLAMGLPIEEIMSLPLPAEEFPVIDTGNIPGPELNNAYIELALAQRADLKAQEESENAAGLALLAARDALRPAVDLVVNVGYTGTESEEYLSSGADAFTDNITGLNSTATLSWSWPTWNNTAKGSVAQYEAQAAQQRLTTLDKRRNIASEVLVALDNLRTSAAQLEQTMASARFYRNALRNEREKQRLGVGTLISIINTEDWLTSAEQNVVSGRRAVAEAIVDLRYVTGTLLRSDDLDNAVGRQELLTIPEVRSEE